MAKRKGSLLRQLTLGLGLAIVFLSLASFYYQYQVQKQILVGSIRANLCRQTGVLATWLGRADSDEAREEIARQYVATIAHIGDKRTNQEVIIVDKDSRIIAATASLEPGQPYANPLLSEVLASREPVSEPCHTEAAGEYVAALPVYADATRTTVAAGILLKQPLTAVGALAESLMLNSFILLAGTLVVIVVVVYYVLRVKVHQPMQAIFMQEYRIREGDLPKIEAEDPQNEFSDLYAMYNEMVMRIADQKRAILEQKNHVTLAHLVRQAIARLTGPLDEILTRSRSLLESQSSLSEEDRATLKHIIANITRIARELKSIVMEGDKSATLLKQEAEKIRDYKLSAAEE